MSELNKSVFVALLCLVFSSISANSQTSASKTSLPAGMNDARQSRAGTKPVRVVEVPDLGLPDLNQYLDVNFDVQAPVKPKITGDDVRALGNPAIAFPPLPEKLPAPLPASNSINASSNTAFSNSLSHNERPVAVPNSSLVVLARRDNALQRATYSTPEMVLIDPGVAKVGCTRCGQLGDPGDLNFGYCATGRCTPGRAVCYPYAGDSFFQRVSSLIYQCLTCPDPCYEPSWNPLANAAFMIDSPRPQTMLRIKYDRWSNITTPDRGGFFWSQANGKGLGPSPLRLAQSGSGIKPPVPQPVFVNIDEGTYSMEAGAAGKMAFFLNFPYRLVNTNDTYAGGAGFGDMSLGTKSVLIDTELLLLTFQFKTYMPIGNASRGTGLGVVRLEPSLIWSTKLSEKTFFQGQLGEWVPLGGSNYFGSVLLSKFALNHELTEIIPNVPLIGVLEIDGWTFQSGRYTQLFSTPNKQIATVTRSANTQSYWNIGPGARIAFGNKADLGMGLLFGMGSQSWGNPIVTVDLRWMY
jgi:hypothetical protein